MDGVSTNDRGRGMGVCAVEIRGCHKTAGAVLHAQAQPERPKGEGHGWPEFYSPQMRGNGGAISNFRFHDFLPRRLHGLAPTCALEPSQR